MTERRHSRSGPVPVRMLPFAAALVTMAFPQVGLALQIEQAQPDAQAVQQGLLPQLVTDLDRAEARIDEVEENLALAQPADRPLFEFQRRQRWTEHHAALLRLGEAIQAEETGTQTGTPDSAVVARALTGLEREMVALRAWLADTNVQSSSVRGRLLEAPPEDLLEGALELTGLVEDLVDLTRALTDDLELGAALGMDLEADLASHDQALQDYAELAGADLEMQLETWEDQREWLALATDSTAVQQRIAATDERIRGATAALRGLVELLERRGFDASDYQALIVSATGQVGTQVLNTRVLESLLTRWRARAAAWARANLGSLVLRIVLILLILLSAGRVTRVVRNGVERTLERTHLTSLVRNLLVSVARAAVWAIVILIAMSILGIDLAPMLAGLGIAGFVVGFALQDTLANFAAGVMIMIYRPFDVGDFVTAGGVTGVVKKLTLVSTVIRTIDNRRIIVPNGKVWGDVINNATAERLRMVDMLFGISYGDDVDRAITVLEDVLAQHELILDDPAPMVRVGNLNDSSVDLICRPWCKTEDYWELKWSLTRAVKKRFDAEGISIPFPQRDVHLHPVPSPGEAGTAG